MIVFDHARRHWLMTRAAARFGAADFLRPALAASMLDRLADVRRDFDTVLCVGARAGAAFLRDVCALKSVRRLYVLDPCAAWLQTLEGADMAGAHLTLVQGDDERLPFDPAMFDLAVGAATLHAVNDVPGALIQIRRALKPDSLFIAAMPGGRTLHELRHGLMQAELALYGGAAPRVLPFADMQQVAALMQRAGFALPVVDAEVQTVEYRALASLLRDLRAMGEGNCLAARNTDYRGKAFLAAVDAACRAAFTAPASGMHSGGRIAATFETIFALGWAPHDSQQKPMRPGSAQTSLTEVL